MAEQSRSQSPYLAGLHLKGRLLLSGMTVTPSCITHTATTRMAATRQQQCKSQGRFFWPIRVSESQKALLIEHLSSDEAGGPKKMRMILQDLKAKTRVRVPRAALLMGVMDEEGVLEPGQVRTPTPKSNHMLTEG